MTDLLKDIRANVLITDTSDGAVLLYQHNLFVRTGRTLLRDVLISGSLQTFALTNYVVEFGSGAAIPTEDDTDLITPFNPAVYTNTLTPNVNPYPRASNAATGPQIEYQFDYTNATGSPIIFRELGLFYRPNGANPGFPRTNVGTLMARLKTTYASVTIGTTRTITINWKFIF